MKSVHRAGNAREKGTSLSPTTWQHLKEGNWNLASQFGRKAEICSGEVAPKIIWPMPCSNNQHLEFHHKKNLEASTVHATGIN